jgi:DNA-directed RNA polymerase subunit E'/Rpb7
MDTLYERRELTRSVHIHARSLKRNIHESIVEQLRHKYEGVCLSEGYIQPASITIVDYSLGRTNILKGGLDYSVRFQADVCLPHIGQVFRAPVVMKSKIGLHAETSPIKILLPRDLHINIPDFETADKGQMIEFDVVGTRFQQGDKTIIVLGKLREVIRQAVETETAEPEINEVTAAPISKEDSNQRVVTVDVEKTKPAGESRRKKLIRTVAPTTNESKSEGKSEGTT